jgi:hypothetical protein
MKKLIAMVAGVAAVLGAASGAYAGESGVAGSAAFSIDPTTTSVTGVAVSAAVGKHDAAAFAHQGGTITNVAGALGSDGVITQSLFDANGGSIGFVTEQVGSEYNGDPTQTLINNDNSFSGGLGVIQIGTATDNVIVELTPPPAP